MKKYAAILPCGLILLAGVSSAHAQSGTITFNGQVSSVTCEVSFNGVIGNDPSIRLPKVPVSALPDGSSAGRTEVNLHVEGADPVCTNGGITVQLDPRRAARLQNGRLVNQALSTNGSNVLVGMRDGQDRLINLGAGWTSPTVPGTGNGTDIKLYAEYHAEGGATLPGVFQAPLQYTLIYP